MYYVVSTAKSPADAARDLEASVQKHQFGVLHVHDLKETLTRRGYPLAPQCKIFEVCNPQQASQVLERDLRLNMALPCRISVFEENGVTKIGTILPSETLRMLSHDREIGVVAAAVEKTIKAVIDDAAAPLDARSALSLRRAALVREIEAGAAKRGEPRDGNVPDSAELSADDVVRDVTMAEIDRDTAELKAIDAALERLDAGTYGRCIDCGTKIPKARLAQNPEVARCVACQRHREQDSAPRSASL
jgi:RNA polymerase-binding transcription factor DksA/uncharacterized protein (DUF302 family)